jgi:hypothetical protein
MYTDCVRSVSRPDRFWGPPASYSVSTGGSYRRMKEQGSAIHAEVKNRLIHTFTPPHALTAQKRPQLQLNLVYVHICSFLSKNITITIYRSSCAWAEGVPQQGTEEDIWA